MSRSPSAFAASFRSAFSPSFPSADSIPCRSSPSPSDSRSAMIPSRSFDRSACASRFSTPLFSLSRSFFASSASFFSRSRCASSRALASPSRITRSSAARSAILTCSTPGGAAAPSGSGGNGIQLRYPIAPAATGIAACHVRHTRGRTSRAVAFPSTPSACDTTTARAGSDPSPRSSSSAVAMASFDRSRPSRYSATLVSDHRRRRATAAPAAAPSTPPAAAHGLSAPCRTCHATAAPPTPTASPAAAPESTIPSDIRHRTRRAHRAKEAWKRSLEEDNSAIPDLYPVQRPAARGGRGHEGADATATTPSPLRIPRRSGQELHPRPPAPILRPPREA